MATKCENCPLRRRDLFTVMTDDEVAAMQRFKVGELTVDPGTTLLMQGSNSPQLFTALHGQGLRYKLLSNGNRQVVNVIMPGDFIGLQAGLMGEMGHSAEATTKMTLCVFDRGELWNFFKSNPERGFDLAWIAATEEHFLGETVSTLGQRTALQSVAWALVKMFKRADGLGMVTRGSTRLPYKQQDLADMLGLSLVHTNKTLGRLKSLQLASWSNGVLQINDLNALAEVALLDDQALPKRPIM